MTVHFYSSISIYASILGDPAVVHSHFIAKIYSWSESFSSLSIIQDGRLAGKVKKNILLCSLKPDDTMCYITLYWSGVS